MPLRYLVGPVGPARARIWKPMRQAGRCLTFDAAGSGDLLFRPDESWEEVLARLPEGFVPDLVVLDLGYTTVPHALWQAPVPLVGLATDPQLQVHWLRHVLPRLQRVYCALPGVEGLRRAGFDHARPVLLFGLQGEFAEPPMGPLPPRDIDLLFVGNLNPAVQGARLPWLGRIARLSRRWKVVIARGVFGEEYRRLLLRSRVVFDRSLEGEWNLRVGEACSHGALLFAEAGNREMAGHWRHGENCVFYDDEDLEDLLSHYLGSEEERARVAEAGRATALAATFESSFGEALVELERDWPRILEGHRGRPAMGPDELLSLRAWQALGAADAGDPALLQDLEARLTTPPEAPVSLSLAHGVLTAARGRDREGAYLPEALHALAGRAHQATVRDPGHALAALDLIEALVVLGQPELAVRGARRLLDVLVDTPLSADALRSPRFPVGYDPFRAGWEEAAWRHGGSPAREERAKRDLLRWRLHCLLGDLTGEVGHLHEAALLRPGHGATRAALGCALARQERWVEAVGHLRCAVEADPFDTRAARALYQALVDSGRKEAAGRLAHERWLLHRAAESIVPLEPWFTPVPGTGTGKRPLTQGLAVRWEGPFFAQHSLGRVNRELALGLAARGHELSLFDVPSPGHAIEPGVERDRVQERLGRYLPRPEEVCVRLAWPPSWRPPARGHWIVAQPWEYGAIPRAWVEPIRQQVDEVWVPSRHVRDGFVASGVPEDRVVVLPLGVDEARFRPEGERRALATQKALKFLFVGGTIHRKGIDLLLEAYRLAFRRQDDVCLVVKDMGVGSFYRGQTAEGMIQGFRLEPGYPEVLYLDENLSDEQMAELYRACDVLVHPYRGEGFGLPIVEAMACGLPVVVTGQGAALDFVDEANGWLIPARLVRFPEKRLDDQEMVDYPTLAEPDVEALSSLLRQVAGQKEERRRRGQAGRKRVLERLTWTHAVAAVEQRLLALRGKTPRRERGQPTAVEPARTREPMRFRQDGPKVSLCVIARDEEANIAACLEGARGLVEDVVVVDTGSKDRTRQIARDLGARVFEFPWVDNFAAARNATLEHAVGRWIFWLDADDRIDAENRDRLRRLFDSLPDEANVGWSMKCRCLPDPVTNMVTVVDHVRLFRNHPRIRWRYRIHEQILGAVKEGGGEVRFTDVVIDHTGYTDPALRRRKLDRDLRLLQMEHAEQPHDPFTLFNLGATYVELGRHREALGLLEESLGRSHPSDSIVRKLFSLLTSCRLHLGEAEEALRVCARGQAVCPDDAELLLMEGMIRTDAADYHGAKAALLRLLHGDTGPHFASVADGLRTYRGRHQLALVCQRQGEHAEAEALWRRVRTDQPGFLPALAGLANLYLEGQRWDDLEAALAEMEQLPRGDQESAYVRGKALFARREFGPARDWVRSALERWPDCLPMLLLYSHVLLEEDRDQALAERVLEEVLRLEPGNANARQNLGVLRQRMARDRAFL